MVNPSCDRSPPTGQITQRLQNVPDTNTAHHELESVVVVIVIIIVIIIIIIIIIIVIIIISITTTIIVSNIIAKVTSQLPNTQKGCRFTSMPASELSSVGVMVQNEAGWSSNLSKTSLRSL